MSKLIQVETVNRQSNIKNDPTYQAPRVSHCYRGITMNNLSKSVSILKLGFMLTTAFVLSVSTLLLLPAPAALAQDPIAEFTVSSDSSVRGTESLTVTFVNSSTSASEYHWQFGDGGVSSAISPTHIYNTPGHYTVTLSITTTEGITAVEEKAAYVTVSPAPSEPFEDLDKDGYADLVVSGYQDDASCNSCYQADSYIYWG
ncbi:MAG: PKD domain-containing protein, partial [Chloroflexi bacterium]|nr:PKD domain-containing protein [Chloroflexota bacterium]